ncbi:hypothetical protein LOTGIDRAFT_153679 [Lottia gigantea]|uniref:ABC transmembrane type-1 domain-containing protein n=1 Tax=Lottia gigantea TaxID=225164 RepID=V4A3D8_LOTGI|nr:hypothetical protein LOTGIDRAFT_153679 [Lottia gigantea]ESO91247.1 hypothetical protein LOTGIDRAFT_153679 [Lottia gigantea]
MEETDEKTPLLGKENGRNEVNGYLKTDESKLSSSLDKNGESKKEDVQSATFGELFAYATCLDKFLMIIGSLFAMGSGAAWPVMTLIFGKMTNSFIQGEHCEILSI